MEILERRWTPDDILSAASAPVTMGGLVLLAGSHITPMRLLLDSAPPAADAPAPQPDTSAAPYRYTEPDDPLLTDGGFDDLAFVAATGHVPADEGLACVSNTPSDLANPDEPAKEMAVNDGPADGFLNSSTAAARAAKAPATTSPPSPPAAAAAANSPAKYAGAGGGSSGGSSTPNAGKGGGGPTGGGSANLHLPSLTSLQQFLPGNDAAIASNATAAPAAVNHVQFADNAVATPPAQLSSPATPQSSIGPSDRETAAPPAPPAPAIGSSTGNNSSSSTNRGTALQSSTLNLRSSAVSAVSGQLVTFTATVSSPAKSLTPTGTVVFSNGGQTLGSAVLHNGTASLATTNLTVGSYMLRAAYQGDSRFFASANTQSQTVHPDGTAVTLHTNGTLAASAQAVTFTATVNALAPGSGTPTGMVDFLSGSVELGKAKLNGGLATFTASGLMVSSGGVRAVYEGDSQFRGSQVTFAPSLSPSLANSASSPVPAGLPSSNTGSGRGSNSGSGMGSTRTGAGSQIQDNFAASGSGSGANAYPALAKPITHNGTGTGSIGTGISPPPPPPVPSWSAISSYTQATIAPITATEGYAYSGTVITSLYDPDPSTQYSEVVNWGDGATSGTIAIGSTSSLPTLTHTYTLAGSYYVSDTIIAKRGPVTAGSPPPAGITPAVTTGTNGNPGGTLVTALTALYTNALIYPALLHVDDRTVDWPNALTNVTFATFDVPVGKASNYTATIDWGDGSGPLQATIASAGGGIYDVVGSHTYLHPGQFETDIRVSGGNGGNADVREGTGYVKVLPPFLPPDLVFTNGDMAVGVSMSRQDVSPVNVATFTIGDTHLTSTALAATINWGDNTTPSLGVLSGGGGSFSVSGSHFYAHPGQYLLTVNVVSPLDTLLGWGTAHVATPSVGLVNQIPANQAANYAANSPYPATSMLLATFTDPNPHLTAADFQATVNWGDGSAKASLSGSDGTFWISGSPLYSGPYQNYGAWQRYLVQINVADLFGDNLATSDIPVNVVDGTAAGQTPFKPDWFHMLTPKYLPASPPYAGYNFIGKLFWGDGTPVLHIAPAPTFYPIFPVGEPGHVYASEGTYTQVVDFGVVNALNPPTTDWLASASQSVTVDDHPLINNLMHPVTLSSAAGTAINNANLDTFFDNERDAAAGLYTATIDWGDGVSSTGNFIVVHPWTSVNGATTAATFTLQGSHTYQKPGTYQGAAEIKDKDGTDMVVTFTALISSASPPPPPPPSFSLSGLVRSDDPDRAFLLPNGEATVDLNMGAVRINQPLDFDASPGTTIGGSPALVYNSATANGKPIIQASFKSTIVPQSVTFTVTWEGTTLTPVVWKPPPLQTGPYYDATITVAQAVTASGVYDWTLQAQAVFNGTTYDGTCTGSADVVINNSSPYGANWGLQSTSRLVSDLGGDMMRIDAAGDQRLFTYTANGTPDGSYTSPAEDFGTLSGGLLLGYYLYTAKDQTQYYYDLNGRLYQTVLPNTWTTAIAYNAGLLNKIVAPDHGSTTFTYDSSGLLDNITEPVGRGVTLTDSGSDVTQIVDAVGDLRMMSYDGTHDLTADSWLPYDSAFTYSNIGLVTGLSQSPVEYTLTSAQSASILNAAGLPLAQTIDGIGDVTKYLLDRRGRQTWEQQPDGHTATWQLSAAGDVESYVDFDGYATGYSYVYGSYNSAAGGGDGDLITVSYPNGTQDSYAYDSTFHNVILHVDPDGDSTNYQYDSDSELTLQTIGYGSPAAATTKYGWSDGLLVGMRDPDNNVTAYVYSTNLGFLLLNQTLYNASGIAVSSQSYSYDGNGNPKSMVDSDKGVTGYEYDNDNNLTQTTDPDGIVTSQQYTAADLPVYSVDGRGSSSDYGYDAAGLETVDEEAANEQGYSEDTRNAYNPAGELTLTTDPVGNQTSFGYNADGYEVLMIQGYGTPQAAATQYAPDPDGRVTLSVDADGNATSYAYDPVGNQVLAIEGYKTSAASTTSSAYDGDGNLVVQVLGSDTTDAEPTSYAYDADGNQVLTVVGAGTQAESTTSKYDGDGNLTQQIDGDGYVSSYNYDAMGNQTLAIVGYGTPQVSSSSQQYDGNSNLTQSIDGDGNLTTYNYDPDGNLIQQIAGYDTSAASTSSFAYDKDANQTMAITGANTSAAETTSSGYDYDNNQTLSISGVGSSQPEFTVSSYDRDNQLIQQVDPTNATSDFSYDPLGNQTAAVTAAGTSSASTTTQKYDGVGNLTLSVDGAGDSTSYDYDPVNNQTLETDGYGSSAAAMIHYGYDAAGNQTQEVDPVGNSTAYQYDSVGNQTAVIDPLGNSTIYGYDKDSNVTLQTNANGSSIAMTYDAEGQVLTETDYMNGTEQDSKGFSYDGNGNTLTASNNYGSYSYIYDAVGNLTKQTDPFGLTLTYGYDACGNVTSMEDSLGGTTSYINDANGNVTSIRFSNGTSQARVDLTYTNDNQVATLTRYADTGGTQLVGQSSYSYDPAGNVTEIKHTNASGGVLADYQYKYDSAYRLTSETDTENGGGPMSSAYGYDARSELTSVNGSGYTYDANGNRTMTGYSTGPGNQLQSDGTWNYSYDANGNTIQKTNIKTGEYWTYAWNAANQLTLASDYQSNGTLIQSVTFKYDVFGNQVEEDDYNASTQQTTVTKYAYDADGNIWADLNSSNQLVDRRLFVNINGQTQPLVRVDASSNGAWYLTDHLGSIRLLTDNASSVLDQIDYDAYGNITNETNTKNSDRYKWASGQWNAILGLYHFADNSIGRWYDPKTGVWTSEDPLGLQPGPNPRDYVNNNPTNAIDPTGLDDFMSPLWTEHSARDALTEQIKEWRGKKNYHVAANLLEHFLDNNGRPYIGNKEDQENVSRESEKLIRRIIASEFQFGKDFNPLQRRVYYKGKVRWVDEGMVGALDEKSHSNERFIDTNPELFVTFGGARMDLKGTVIASERANRTRDGQYFIVSVKAKVTISDNYSFAPTGPLNVRLFFNSYSAAHFLETINHYKTFHDSVTFEKTYDNIKVIRYTHHVRAKKRH